MTPNAMIEHFLLDSEGNPTPYTGNDWFEKWEDLRGRRTIAKEQVTKKVTVSCVFTGVGKPFEIRVFGGEMDNWRETAVTRNEAITIFDDVLQLVKKAEGVAGIESFKDDRRNSDWAF